MFTAGQLALLIFVSEIFLYSLFRDLFATIRYCSMARAYRALQKDNVNVSYDEFASAFQNNSNKKEESKDGTNN